MFPPPAICHRVAHLTGVLAIAVLAACRGGDSAAPPLADPSRGPSSLEAGIDTAGPDDGAAAVNELLPLLVRAGGAGVSTEAEKLALEQAMQRLLLPVASLCEGCATTVSYVDETAGGDHFRCVVRATSGDAVAEIEIYHRAALPLEAPASWGRATVGGYPASGLPREHLFVWPGRIEIRAFARTDSLRGAGELEGLIESLPLDALARL